MEEKEYQQLVTKLTPKPKKLRNAIIAFASGGCVGILGEIINQVLQRSFSFNEADAIIWTVLFFVFIGSLFTAIGFFDDWMSYLKAGLIIPITGFAHSITSSALDYKKDGLITGLGSNFFKLAGSVLLYGIIAAFILTIIKAVFLCLA